MRTLSLLALLSLAGFAALAPAPVMAQGYGQVIRCESYDFRDNYCPADTRGGVRIARQVSRTACYEGESWGYDRRGIWVTNGCAAEFEVGGGGYGGRYGDRGGRGRDPGWRSEGYGGGGYGRGGGGGGRIVCESRDFRYRYCAAPVGRDVDLVYQISKTECRYGRSWGWDRGGVWVDRGCAAEFAIY